MTFFNKNQPQKSLTYILLITATVISLPNLILYLHLNFSPLEAQSKTYEKSVELHFEIKELFYSMRSKLMGVEFDKTTGIRKNYDQKLVDLSKKVEYFQKEQRYSEALSLLDNALQHHPINLTLQEKYAELLQLSGYSYKSESFFNDIRKYTGYQPLVEHGLKYSFSNWNLKDAVDIEEDFVKNYIANLDHALFFIVYEKDVSKKKIISRQVILGDELSRVDNHRWQFTLDLKENHSYRIDIENFNRQYPVLKGRISALNNDGALNLKGTNGLEINNIAGSFISRGNDVGVHTDPIKDSQQVTVVFELLEAYSNSWYDFFVTKPWALYTREEKSDFELYSANIIPSARKGSLLFPLKDVLSSYYRIDPPDNYPLDFVLGSSISVFDVKQHLCSQNFLHYNVTDDLRIVGNDPHIKFMGCHGNVPIQGLLVSFE